jgi:hypothetical protein
MAAASLEAAPASTRPGRRILSNHGWINRPIAAFSAASVCVLHPT